MQYFCIILDLQAESLGEAMVVSNSDKSRIEPVELCTTTLVSTSNTTISKPAHASPDIEAMISKPHLASTSYPTQSKNLISGS